MINGRNLLFGASTFPALLLLGLVIRLPALLHPVQEGQRNAQTACLTANMLEGGHLRLDPVASWRGDLDARLVQELPLYNLAVLALKTALGVSVDLAGRSFSLIFWLLSFWVLQNIWSVALPQSARPWANLLYVFAPMSWYLSTAFMPETLVQLLSLSFLALALRHAGNPSFQNLTGLTLVGALGLLIKFPAFVHLGLFFVLVLVDRQGIRAFFRPALWLAGLLIALALLGWGRYVDHVNGPFFPFWRGWENFYGFLQPNLSRFSFQFWVPLAGYNLAFILPAVLVPFGFAGLLKIWKDRRKSFESRIWLYLFLSLLAGWLIWAKAAPSHSYYNFPNLPFFCALFGLGVSGWLETWFRSPRIKRLVSISMVFLLLLWGTTGYLYLARPDTVTCAAAAWLRAHTLATDLVIYQPRHMASVLDYEHQPLLSHASLRRTWIWTRMTPQWEKERALQTSRWLIVTQPSGEISWIERLRRFFKGMPAPPPINLAEEMPDQWQVVCQAKDFIVYQKAPGRERSGR